MRFLGPWLILGGVTRWPEMSRRMLKERPSMRPAEHGWTVDSSSALFGRATRSVRQNGAHFSPGPAARARA